MQTQYIVLSWIVTVGYLIAMLWIGLYFSKKQTSSEEFFLGGQSLSPFVLAGTFAATWISGGTALGIIGTVWQQGFSYIWVPIVSWLGGIFTILFIVDKMRQSGHITVPELLGSRYDSKAVGVITAGLIAVVFVIFFVVQFKAAGVAAEVFLGINYKTALFLFGSVIIIYSAMGGFLAVCYTDVVQAGIVVVGMVIGTIIAVVSVGGFDQLIIKLAAIDPNLITASGPNGWMGVPSIIQQGILWTGYNTCAAHTAVRYFAGSRRSTNILGIGLGWGICTITSLCTIFLGTSARILHPELVNMDYAFPTLMAGLVPWFGVIINVAIIAAVMSTIDSGLLVVSSAIVRDIYMKFTKKEVPAKTIVKISQVVTVAAGAGAMLLAINPPESIFMFYSAVWSVMVAGIFLPLVFGFYTRWANKTGVIASIVIAAPATFFYQLNPFIPNVQAVGFGVAISLACMILGSLLFTKDRVPKLTVDRYVGLEKSTTGPALISVLENSIA